VARARRPLVLPQLAGVCLGSSRCITEHTRFYLQDTSSTLSSDNIIKFFAVRPRPIRLQAHAPSHKQTPDLAIPDPRPTRSPP
jgi:hypothetical protein